MVFLFQDFPQLRPQSSEWNQIQITKGTAWTKFRGQVLEKARN